MANENKTRPTQLFSFKLLPPSPPQLCEDAYSVLHGVLLAGHFVHYFIAPTPSPGPFLSPFYRSNVLEEATCCKRGVGLFFFLFKNGHGWYSAFA